MTGFQWNKAIIPSAMGLAGTAQSKFRFNAAGATEAKLRSPTMATKPKVHRGRWERWAGVDMVVACCQKNIMLFEHHLTWRGVTCLSCLKRRKKA